MVKFVKVINLIVNSKFVFGLIKNIIGYVDMLSLSVL